MVLLIKIFCKKLVNIGIGKLKLDNWKYIIKAINKTNV